MFQYYSECLLGVGTVSGDECGLLGFQWCFIIAFAVLFQGPVGPHGEFDST